MTRRTASTIIAAVLAVGVVVGVAGALLSSGAAKPRPAGGGLRGTIPPAGLVRRGAPAFRLEDARTSRPLDSRTLLGHPYAITFLYTRCPDICPLIGQELRIALGELGSRSRDVSVVAISVDPRGDTRPAVRAWLERQGQPANFHYLIGSRAQLAPIWSRYYVAPQITGRPETSTHTATVWLVDARGRMRESYAAGSAVAPKDLAHDLARLIDERSS
jgi:protein SCO1/2